MLSVNPRALDDLVTVEEPPLALEAPTTMVERYLELVAQRRHIEDQIAYLRSELEMIADAALTEDRPRGRFRGATGQVAARLQPSCSFDRVAVAKELQRQGRLADVAILQGPSLARFLSKEPVVAARLGNLVRPRTQVMLMATG